MLHPLHIPSIHGQPQFPDIEEIKGQLAQHKAGLKLEFEGEGDFNSYRQALQAEFSYYHVFYLRWKPEIWISPALETDSILEKQDEIMAAARAFWVTATELMAALGKAHGIDPANRSDLHGLKKRFRDNQQRGAVNAEWSFWLHGSECQFTHATTGQVVEVVVTYADEFGALDSFFFLQYLQTTPRFQELAAFFEGDRASITKALNLLEDAGQLKRIDEGTQRGIVAL